MPWTRGADCMTTSWRTPHRHEKIPRMLCPGREARVAGPPPARPFLWRRQSATPAMPLTSGAHSGTRAVPCAPHLPCPAPWPA
eukprot:9466733-Pyramimonas_sp.AAC.1